MRFKVNVATSQVAIAQDHRQDNDKANENMAPRQDPAPQLPDTFSLDDIIITASTTAPNTTRRRNSEPAQPTAAATNRNMAQRLQNRIAAFSLFLAEHRMRYIQYAETDPMPPAPTVPVTPPSPPEPELQCLICCQNLPKEKDARHSKEVVKPCRCDNAYCKSCIKNMFIQACKDSTRMPPRCCTQIHLHHARPYLAEEEIATFKAKYEEWSTSNPFYCPVPTCSAFIPERLLPESAKSKGKRVDSGIGTPIVKTFGCPTCNAAICAECRQPAHPDSMCNIVEFGIDAETAALLTSWGYKKCPKCGHGLKRMYGCNHMECRCGAHFCWVCLQDRDDCDGECYDSEDDDNQSYAEPDEAEDPTLTSRPTDSTEPVIRDSLPEVTVTDASAEAPSTDLPTTTASPAIARLPNLDGGSYHYWEEQDLDFGEEPTDDIQDRSWSCSHDFETYKLNLHSALTKDPSTTEMECVKCWCTIHPEIETNKNPRKANETTVLISRGRSIARGRGCRRGRYMPPRGLFRADATVGSTSLSQSVPAREIAPMEDIPYAERIVDTYGNVITTTVTGQSRRASLDLPFVNDGESSGKRPLDGFAFTFNTLPAPKLSLAHECRHCSLLVCDACKNAALAMNGD